MKKKGMVYNVNKIEETLAGNHIAVNSFKDGEPKTRNRQFETLREAIYWITEINMVANCALDVQININLK
jgi:hypothetical protein